MLEAAELALVCEVEAAAPREHALGHRHLEHVAEAELPDELLRSDLRNACQLEGEEVRDLLDADDLAVLRGQVVAEKTLVHEADGGDQQHPPALLAPARPELPEVDLWSAHRPCAARM